MLQGPLLVAPIYLLYWHIISKVCDLKILTEEITKENVYTQRISIVEARIRIIVKTSCLIIVVAR